MKTLTTISLILAMLAALCAPLMLGGCGSTGGSSDALRQPVEDPSQPSSIGGTIFTLAPIPGQSNGMIDQAYGATITLDGTADNPANQDQLPMTTHSTIRGGFSFPSVPPGVYTLTATTHLASDASVILTSTLSGVRARGNIPTLMVNLLLGPEDNLANVTGTLVQNGQPAAGATASIDITGYTTDYLPPNNDTTNRLSVILSTTADASGVFHFTVPIYGTAYYIGAHSTTSRVSNINITSKMQAAGDVQLDPITLISAETPVFANLIMDIISSTLPAPTVTASRQADITRLAVARALHAPQSRIDRLMKSSSRRQTARVVVGMIENDIYWVPATEDVGVRGYNIYRGTSSKGPFTRIGTNRDPYVEFFFDNDPALDFGTPTSYTVTSVAGNDKESPPSAAITAHPLGVLSLVGATDGESVARANAQVRWNHIVGARRYLIVIYDVAPTVNVLPVDVLEVVAPTTLPSEPLSYPLNFLQPNTYWYSVSAYNTNDPNYATAASFTAYYSMTITP